jgi:hypothetical protein
MLSSSVGDNRGDNLTRLIQSNGLTLNGKKAFGLLDIEHTETCKQQQHAYTIDLL